MIKHSNCFCEPRPVNHCCTCTHVRSRYYRFEQELLTTFSPSIRIPEVQLRPLTSQAHSNSNSGQTKRKRFFTKEHSARMRRQSQSKRAMACSPEPLDYTNQGHSVIPSAHSLGHKSNPQQLVCSPTKISTHTRPPTPPSRHTPPMKLLSHNRHAQTKRTAS